MVNYLNHCKRINTERFHGHGVKFSPHMNDGLAVAGAENFGIKGIGSLLLYNLNSPNPLQQRYHYQDAIFDLSWSKYNPSLVLTGSGDGCIQFWVINKSHKIPSNCIKLHHKEVSSVEFAISDSDYFSSSSWDSTIALSTTNSQTPATVLRAADNDIIYEARWSPVRNRALASVSGNGSTVIWSPFSSNQPTLILGNVGAETLSCDWSFADPNLLVTASTHAVIYLWDLRSPNLPVVEMRGHENAIRKVRFNPIVNDEIASVSYDFTTRLWNVISGMEICVTQTHTEFVYGLDFSLLNPGVVADCSWDRTVQIYEIGPHQTQPFLQGPSMEQQMKILDHNHIKPLPRVPFKSHVPGAPVGPPFIPSSPDPFPQLVRKELNNVESSRPLPPLPEFKM